MKEQHLYSHDEIPQIALLLKKKMPSCAVFTFTGSLGAGKTTLIQTLLTLCGVQDYITSPTFTYVNIYRNQAAQTFYHFDLYRIGSLNDFMLAGFNEYLYQPNSWCFIEWPEHIMPLLTHDVCHVHIEYKDATQRLITLETL